NLGVGHGQPRASWPLLGQTEIRFHVEQIILYPPEWRIDCRITGRIKPHQTDHRIDLVKGPVGGDTQVILLAPLVVAERGRTVVPSARIDAIENDNLQRPMIQSVIMMITIATNCSSTRKRISFCDV